MKVLSVSSIDIWNEIVLHKRWNSQFHIWKSRWRFQGVKHKILHYSHTQIWKKKISNLKYEFSVHHTWKYEHKRFCRKCGFFFILELWKSGCRFFDRKYKNVYFTYPTMVTGNMDFFLYIFHLKIFMSYILHEILNTVYLTFEKPVLIFLQEI